MIAPSFPYRLGGLAAGAVLALALAPMQQAAAAAVDVSDGDATITFEDSGTETTAIFLDSWTHDGDEVFGPDDQGQGFFWRSDGDTQEIDQLTPVNISDDPDATGNVIDALYMTGLHTVTAQYTLTDLGGGVSQIVETFVLDIIAFDDVNYSFFIWANPDLGTNAGDDYAVLSNPDAVHSNTLYTQRDQENAARIYTMESSVSAITTTEMVDPLTLSTTAVKSHITTRNTALAELTDMDVDNFDGSATSLGGAAPAAGADPTVVFQYDFFFKRGCDFDFDPITGAPVCDPISGGATTQQVTISMTKTFTTPTVPTVGTPEPASLALLAAGGALLLGFARRRRS